MKEQVNDIVPDLQRNYRRASTFCKSLSPRQGDIVEYMVLGYKNEKIAAELGLKPKTVKNTIRAIFRKLAPTSDEDPRAMAVILWCIYNRRKLAKVKSRGYIA